MLRVKIGANDAENQKLCIEMLKYSVVGVW